VRLGLTGVHLAGLWTLAFVQPLFAVLGDEPAFFVARDNTAGDVLILAFGWTLVPPLIALAAVALLKRPALLALVGLLSAVIALHLLKGLGVAAVPLAAALGAGAAYLYARAEGARTFVTILGIAPVVVLALFLVVSPVRDLVLPSDAPAAGSGARVANPAPVVVLIFDELPTTTLMTPDGEIDARRFPNFGRLARASTWYRNATSVSDGTYVAVPAILTGVRPEAELPTSREYPRNLFTLLGRGYEHHVHEPITSVCPDTLCVSRAREGQLDRLKSLARDLSVVERRVLLPEPLVDHLPEIDRDFEDFGGGEADEITGDDLPTARIRAARAVTRTMRPGGEKPGLWMVHHVVPHVPWRFLPDGRQYPVAGPEYPGLTDQTWGQNSFLLDQARQRHVLMSQFADRLLGEAIDRMQRSGLWDEALVVVVADHGVAFDPGGSRRPVTEDNFGGVAGVPLFVKAPGQDAPRASDAFVTTLDVVPTIAKALGVDTDWAFDGIPVDEPRDPETLQQRNGREARLVSVAPGEFVRQRDATLAERLENPWQVGPRPDLVGRPLTSLAAGPPADGFLNNADLYGDVDPNSEILPVYVAGAWEGIEDGADLAVAVNGRIAATGEAYLEHGDPRFSVLIPPASLRPGANEIEVAAVEGETYRQVVATP
jgi:hypothetical protein